MERSKSVATMLALAETIKSAGPDGAPSGPMYQACMERGIDIDEFKLMMAILVETGMVRESNNCYFWAR